MLEKIEQIWVKADRVNLESERRGFRKDCCGAWIQRNEHGNRESAYGWEAHHEIPKSRGGTDDVSNLVPLHCKNNMATGNGYHMQCPVTSLGNKNVARR